ncbi:MAG TPA: thioredoxin family protein [Casimicrobiaceae bacterium]|nr:thioredoxin family protein [Casimicrobiaceae bacterium]
MKVLTAAANDRAAIAAAFAGPARLVVVALCAAWCDTCAEFRAAFDRLALSRPRTTFVWLDIEDDAEVVGDVDVENFPTLAIYRGGDVLHFGVSLPHETTVGRLVDALADQAPALGDPPDEVVALGNTLRR